jgi:dynein heavy chain, axonemal
MDGGIGDYAEQLKKQILDLVALVRGGLSRAKATTIGALVVVDVHAKDVIEKLAEEGVNDEEAFEWISQMR